MNITYAHDISQVRLSSNKNVFDPKVFVYIYEKYRVKYCIRNVVTLSTNVPCWRLRSLMHLRCIVDFSVV